MDRLALASEAAFVLERMGLVACGRKKDGVVSVDVWMQRPQGTVFVRYEVDHDQYTAETLAAACAAALATTERPRSDQGTDG